MSWQVGVLRREMAVIDKQVAEAERLLRLADPDGYYREGTRAAEAAKAKGIKAMEVEKQRREAEERQRRECLVRTHIADILNATASLFLGIFILVKTYCRGQLIQVTPAVSLML